jgi:hypothetical protein
MKPPITKLKIIVDFGSQIEDLKRLATYCN